MPNLGHFVLSGSIRGQAVTNGLTWYGESSSFNRQTGRCCSILPLSKPIIGQAIDAMWAECEEHAIRMVEDRDLGPQDLRHPFAGCCMPSGQCKCLGKIQHTTVAGLRVRRMPEDVTSAAF